MMTVRLAVALAVLGVAGANPSALVHRLGAPKYADREAASAALQRLGSEALPSLKAARSDRDAEVRIRAEVLVERIESDLLVRPTMVALDFQDRPLAEVVRELGARGRAALALAPAQADGTGARRIRLTNPEPVPFWTAVEELSRQNGLELAGGMPIGGFGRGGGPSSALNLMPRPEGSPPAPSSVSGPFRVSLLNLSYHKERFFGGRSNGNPGMIGLPPGVMPNGGLALAPLPMGGASSSEQFQAGLQILAEPRLAVSFNGPVRLSEATDDRGNSLLFRSDHGAAFQHSSGYNRFEVPGHAALQTTVALKYPDLPGRTIKRIKGTIPVTVSARKEDPLVIALADAKGKTYHNSEISLTVHEVRADPNFGQTILDVSVRPLDPSGSSNGGMVAPEFLAIRTPNSPQNQFEVADSQGRVYTTWNLMSQMQGPDGIRMTLRIAPQKGTGAPSQIRYYEMARMNTEAEFEFRNVAMP